MGSEWRIVQLRELTSKITKGTTPTAKDGGFSEYGVNYIRAESVGYSGELSTESFKKIDPSIHEKLKRSQLEENDILFSMAGAFLGKTGLVRKKHLPANTNQALALIRPIRDLVDPNFLLYFFRQNSVVSFVNGSVSQSAQPNINLQEIGSLNIKLPSLQEQQVISKIIGSLDNKIQLNRETNQTLEAMAQALFKSWFVDFDPVFDNIIAHNLAHNNAPLHNIPEPLLPHAQRRLNVHNVGRGSARQTAAHAFHHLFPQAFEQSDEPSVGIQGWIPKGWGVKKIKDFGRVVTGKTPPKSITDAFTDVGFPFITPTDIDNSIYVTKVNRSLSDAGILPLAKNKLPSGSICVTCIGSQMGKTVLSPGEAFTNQQINSVIPYDVENKNYLFMHLRERRDEIFSLGASGSTMPILNKTSFENMSILGSKTTLMKQFTSLTDSYLNGILEKEKQISNLESLRDTLLPKLISGELRIPEAVQASEALAK